MPDNLKERFAAISMNLAYLLGGGRVYCSALGSETF